MFILQHSQRDGILTAFQTLSPWVRSQSYHGNQGTNWAIQEAGFTSFFVMNQRAANYPYSFALFHLLPAVRKLSMSSELWESQVSIHNEHSSSSSTFHCGLTRYPCATFHPNKGTCFRLTTYQCSGIRHTSGYEGLHTSASSGAHCEEALHDRVSQRAHLIHLSIVIPVPYRGFAMQLLK